MCGHGIIVVQSDDYYCYGVLKEEDMEEEESKTLVAVLGGKAWQIWSPCPYQISQLFSFYYLPLPIESCKGFGIFEFDMGHFTTETEGP